MFEGDSEDTCVEKFLLVLTGVRADHQASANGKRGRPTALLIYGLIYM